MEFQFHITRRLHDEHEAVFSLLTRVRRAFGGPEAAAMPDLTGAAWASLLRDFRIALETEIAGHFDLEERALFPLLVEAGAGDLASILNEEHAMIRSVAAPLIGLLRKFRDAGLDAADWRSVRALGLELAERLDAHARKEEVAMLPELDAVLDAEQDRELAASYADGR